MSVSTAARAAASGLPQRGSDSAEERLQLPLWGRVLLPVMVAAGVLLRLGTTSPMWLDEALSVNIAGVGLRDLPDALRQDGAPPLYYALLWAWKSGFGETDHALRLLSAVFSVLTLFAVHRMGRRRGGSVVATAAVVLLATSPFAIHYATEARMYSLVALLSALGWLALTNAFERGEPRWLVATGACAGLLLLTHYWALYLVAVTGAVLLLVAWRRPRRRTTALRCAFAVGAGSIVLFGPWLPTFLYQSQHTGTPWGTPPGPIEVAALTLVDLGGGVFPEGIALAAILGLLIMFAILGGALDAHRIELDLRTRPGVRLELAITAAALLLGVVVGFATNSAWASRYTSITFPLVILVASYGVRAFAGRRAVAVVLVAAAALGVVGGMRNLLGQRSQSEEVAAAVAPRAQPGDVVVYCPDQLGPDVHRVLPSGLVHLTFPDLADPRLVNWVDYAARMKAAEPAAFAAAVLERARGKNIFYVWMPGYRSLEKSCQQVNDLFGNARPGNRQLVEPDVKYFERQVLWLHPATPG